MEPMTLTATPPTKDFVQIARELGPVISRQVDEEENNRRLSPEVINAIKKAGLYKMLLPKSLGGYETDPVTAARTVEEIATHNTAAGWSLMVANTSAWWCRNLHEKGVEEIYASGKDVFLAGSVHPPMQAIRVDGGFSISGRTPLTSNIREAERVFAGAMIFEDGQPKLHNGMPQVIGVCLRSSDIEVADTWHTIGMKATDSNDLVVKNVFVPDHLVFPLMPGREPNKYYDAPLYRFATIGITVTSMIAPVALALAANAIKEVKGIAAKKVPLGSAVSMRDKGVVQRKLGMAEAALQSSRAYLYQALLANWEKTLSGEIQTIEEKANLLLAGTHTVQSCTHAVELMYTAAGSSAIYLKNKLAHYFMDAQVIRQHGFMNESRYETAAQIYLGLPPDLVVVAF
jgi:alkylation response protein AidB-like acyl-CoA dehydrogenase